METTQQRQNSPLGHKDEEVLKYLQARGYKQSAHMFRQEMVSGSQSLARMAFGMDVSDGSPSNYISLHGAKDRSPSTYEENYSLLRDWVNVSLDVYRFELLGILYPVFVHCYLQLIEKGVTKEAQKFMEHHFSEHEEQFRDELCVLQGITNAEQMRENPLTVKFLKYRYSVEMCSFSFELLVSFLQESKFILLLSIINRHINIRVTSSAPQAVAAQEFRAITGKTDTQMDEINNKEVRWGTLKTGVVSMTPEELAKETAEREKAAAEAEAQAEESKKGDEKPEPATKRARKDTKGKGKPSKDDKSAEEKEQPATAGREYADSRIPLPQLLPDAVEQIKKEIQQRVPLTRDNLPSICFFTLLNTHQTLNTVEISPDASMVSCGFNESVVKVWDLQEAAKRGNTINTESSSGDGAPGGQGEGSSSGNSTTSGASGNNLALPQRRSFYKFCGHSGPVYSSTFSPDRQFLLSGSSDNSARLWSFDTGTNLVCYRGHHYPIWDVKFSPLGHYFVTASHDRTARFWSTEHVFPLRIFVGHLADVDCVEFHPNCNYVATGSTDKSVRLWEVHSGSCVRIFTGHRGTVYSLAFSPDGRLLASAGEDRKIILWDIASGKILKTLSGHVKSVWSLDFSRGGNLLASGSQDQTVRLWDVQLARNQRQETHKTTLRNQISPNDDPHLIDIFPTKKTPVFSVKFSYSNLLLASGPFCPFS